MNNAQKTLIRSKINANNKKINRYKEELTKITSACNNFVKIRVLLDDFEYFYDLDDLIKCIEHTNSYKHLEKSLNNIKECIDILNVDKYKTDIRYAIDKYSKSSNYQTACIKELELENKLLYIKD